MLVSASNSFSQIAINEIMYAPADASNEWFEIYNTGNASVNLQNWRWKDATATLRTITNQSINISSNEYLIICQDSVKLKNLYPSLSGVFIQTLWSALNNTGDNLILIDQNNNRIDSVSFLSTWGGNTGAYSLERKIATGNSNTAANWGTSIDQLKATPDKLNSITPKPYDLYLKSFLVEPIFPSKGDTLKLNFIIKNTGINSADNFSLNIYNDNNFDSSTSNNELINTKSFTNLNPDDSLSYSYRILNIDTGSKQYIAKINYESDNDTLNNILYKRVYVSSQSGGGGVVINEIMYEPFTNQSEWIEIYNSTGQEVNLKGWKYKETSTSVILSATDLILNPGDYFILAHDSTIYNSFPYLNSPQINQKIKFINNLSLTNTGELISITDSLNNIIDAVSYNPDWHNSGFDETKGISLERINFAFNSNERSNWSSCTKPVGGTPGLQNSIFTENKPSASNISVSPNPFSPDADGNEDFSLIKYKLNVTFAQMRVKVFDIKGRLVKTLANNSVTGSEGTIIFNGLDEGNQKLRIGIYILLIEAIDDVGGTLEIIKAPIVVAAKL